MKSPFAFHSLLIVILVLALAQAACSLSAPSLSPTLQAVVATAAQAAQNLATQPTANPSQNATPPSGTSIPRGTADEAQAMLKLAVAYYIKVGRTQALADFTHRVAPFFDRDLYVACIDSSLVQSANGGFPELVGSSTQPLSRAAWDAATTGKIDSITYSWINPATNAYELKQFFYEKVGTDVCGVGAYQP